MSTELELVARSYAFDGFVHTYRHASTATGTPMRFSVFLPPSATMDKPAPVLTFLAGLTCTEETFFAKAGALRLASALGLGLVAPDTSPRGANLPGEDDDWDFGTGAGFWLDATEPPWAAHYRMEEYLTRELSSLLTQLPLDISRQSLFGHSMGGHGALALALRHPGRYQSVSAFAPICSASVVPWGEKAFPRYLGADPKAWRAHDVAALVRDHGGPRGLPMLVDQGLDDKFLEIQLRPELLEAACQAVKHPLTLRRHVGYDHSYYFISTFVADHLAWHANALGLSA